MSDDPLSSLADLVDQFPDYDLNLIAARAAQVEPVRRFSQRAEAKRLQPVIAVLVRGKPALKSPEVAAILKAGARVNRDQLGKTFDREVGSQVREAKATKHNRGSGTATERRPRSSSASSPRTRNSNSQSRPLPRTTPPRAGTVLPSQASSSPTNAAGERVPSRRPYNFTGKFAGMVFKHGPHLRQFFNAVQRDDDMTQIRKFADVVLGDSASLDALDKLDVADRAIFDAVAAEIVGGLQQ